MKATTKNETLHDCPHCNGKGKQTIPVTTVTPTGTAHESFEMPCLFCNGKGKVSKEAIAQQEAARKRAEKFWCRCGNPSGETNYHPDTHNSKHHWTCADCGKVTQVG